MDPCTGDVYFSEADEQTIRRLRRADGELETVVELTDPTQLLGVLRAGVSCPDAFHLLVAEPMADQVTRVVPDEAFASLYALAPGIRDLAFLPEGEMLESQGVLLAEQVGPDRQVEQLITRDTYQAETSNPPELSPAVSNSWN